MAMQGSADLDAQRVTRAATSIGIPRRDGRELMRALVEYCQPDRYPSSKLGSFYPTSPPDILLLRKVAPAFGLHPKEVANAENGRGGEGAFSQRAVQFREVLQVLSRERRYDASVRRPASNNHEVAFVH